MGDALRIQQVVVNLLANAAKYTEPGGAIRLSIEATPDQAVIEVRDNGIGIAPEFLPHVFDLFAQGSKPRDGEFSGSGHRARAGEITWWNSMGETSVRTATASEPDQRLSFGCRAQTRWCPVGTSRRAFSQTICRASVPTTGSMTDA